MPITNRTVEYNQVCVWPGTTGCKEDPEGVKEFFQEAFGVRVQFLEEVVTKPDQNDPGTGGRTDVLLAIHSEDVMKFAVKRFEVGIRWIEDVLDNQEHHTPGYSIYPDHVKEYRTW
jgi:hypothetical protein